MTPITIFTIFIVFILWKMIKIIPQRQAGIKERFGKYVKTLTPGFHFMIPFIDSIAYRHEMREQVLDVPPQQCITKDNVQIEVDGIVYLKVMDAYKASYGVANYVRSTVNLAQTTMRSEIGKLTLDHTFSEREKINEEIVREIDIASEPWGIKMIRYEIKNLIPTQDMLITMEKQMEAERQKRAQITMAEADREYKINISSGEKTADINQSEGGKLQRINIAKGKAQEIALISKASADGIKMVATAINKPGGDKAVQMRILEQYLESLKEILAESDLSLVPAGLANIEGFFTGLAGVSQQWSGSPATSKE